MLIIRGECAAADPRRVRVTLHHSEGDESLASAQGRLVYEGTVRFTDQAPEPIAASVFDLAHPRASKFTAERLYGEQWLFHGPPMQALTEVGPVSQEGISGTIAVRPLAGLLRRGEPPSFHTNPIALDTFTHLLGCWAWNAWSKATSSPAPDGPAVDPWSGSRDGHTGCMSDPGS